MPWLFFIDLYFYEWYDKNHGGMWRCRIDLITLFGFYPNQLNCMNLQQNHSF